MTAKPRPALFLDRDGVINVDRGYVSKIEDFEWIDGAVEAIKSFNNRDWFVFIVTNQSGIARGYYTEDDMQVLHKWMLTELSARDARIDHIFYCPFHPEGEIERYRKTSFDRKPSPGMILDAFGKYPVQKEKSFLIGDKQADIDAAHAAGIGGFLFRSGNLSTFAEWALAAFEDGSR